jgi:ribose 5-phosphate isomerase RpiB
MPKARASRRHNDANVLSLGQAMMLLRFEIVEVWLTTEFEAPPHRTHKQIESV